MQRVLAAAERARWERTQRAIATHRKATTRDRVHNRTPYFGWLVIFDRTDNAPQLSQSGILDERLTILNCGRHCHILCLLLHEFNVRFQPSARPAALMSN